MAALDDYNAIAFKSIADRLAEAFAEALHERVRKDLWGYASDEKFTNDELIAEAYTGIRPAPGYPSCPEHTIKKEMFELMDCQEIGPPVSRASTSRTRIPNTSASATSTRTSCRTSSAARAATRPRCAGRWRRCWVERSGRGRIWPRRSSDLREHGIQRRPDLLPLRRVPFRWLAQCYQKNWQIVDGQVADVSYCIDVKPTHRTAGPAHVLGGEHQ